MKSYRLQPLLTFLSGMSVAPFLLWMKFGPRDYDRLLGNNNHNHMMNHEAYQGTPFQYAKDQFRLNEQRQLGGVESTTQLLGQGPHLPEPIIVSPTDYIMQRGFDSSPIVVEKYKLIFFTIPKCGCTVWKQLFRRIMMTSNDQRRNRRGKMLDDHEYDWKNQEVVHDPDLNGLVYLSNYTIKEATHMLFSPDWTKAMFVRDPKERFLSAYLDKAVSNFGSHLRPCCVSLMDKYYQRYNDTTDSSLPAAVTRKMSDITTVDACIDRAQKTLLGFFALIQSCPDDGHWLPQSQRIDAKYWPVFSSSSSSNNNQRQQQQQLFVGNMATKQQDAKRLLTKIGAWMRYGRYGWGEDGKESIFSHGTGQGYTHVTGAKHQLTWYYTPESEQLIDNYYADDYALKILNLSRREIDYDIV